MAEMEAEGAAAQGGVVPPRSYHGGNAKNIFKIIDGK